MFTGKFQWKHLLEPADKGKGSGGINIPSLDTLKGGKAPEAVLEKPPGEAPLPEKDKKEDPPVAPADDASSIPIDAVNPTVTAKTDKKPADYAADRKKAKETKEEAEKRQQELEARAANAETQLAELIKERETWTSDKTRYETDLTNTRTEAEKAKKEAEEYQTKYGEAFKPQINPADDEIFRKAHTSFIEELGSNLPLRVPGQNGEPVRVVFGNLMQSQVFANGMPQVMEMYAQAVSQGSQLHIDRAVNLMAGLLGADTRVEGKDTDKLLASNDPTFAKIEEAMHKACPHFITRAQRAHEVTTQAPKLAQERLTKKTETYRANLAQGVILPIEQAQTLLTENATNSIGLFSALVHHSEPLKVIAQGYIDEFAPAFALVPEGLQLPLTDPTKEGMRKHAESLTRHRRTLADAMQYAVIGKASGPIIAELVSQRDAAEARANAAARNTNPGTGSGAGKENQGGPAPSEDASSIPTETIQKK